MRPGASSCEKESEEMNKKSRSPSRRVRAEQKRVRARELLSSSNKSEFVRVLAEERVFSIAS